MTCEMDLSSSLTPPSNHPPERLSRGAPVRRLFRGSRPGDAGMWHITLVARLRPRLTSVYWPLVARACLIAFSGLVTVFVLRPSAAIAPVLLLLLVAALGTLPVPRTVPAWLQPLTETLAASLVVGALRGNGALFLPYVLLPLATAGITAGLGAALVAAGLASLTLVLATLYVDPSGQIMFSLGGAGSGVAPWTWVLIFIAVAVVAAWMKRVSIGQSTPPDPAYADAHRLALGAPCRPGGGPSARGAGRRRPRAPPGPGPRPGRHGPGRRAARAGAGRRPDRA